MTCVEMAGKLSRLYLVQMHLEPGARLVLTLQTLSRALSNMKACWGAQCHLHMLGPFRKVPDRVTGAIFHALVQCVAPRGSQLYRKLKYLLSANCRGIWFFTLLPWNLLAVFLQAFSPSPNSLSWL